MTDAGSSVGSLDNGDLADAEDAELDELDDDELDEVDPHNRAVGGMSRAVCEYIVRAIVDDPDAAVVEVDEGRRGVTLSVHVAPDDMGKVIGRRGRHAAALRTVVRAAAAREGVDANVDIVD